MRFILFMWLFITVISPNVLLGYSNSNSDEYQRLKKRLNEAKGAEQKVLAYGDLGKYYNEKKYDVLKADSFFLEGIKLARTTFDKSMIIQAYLQFLNNVQLGDDNPEIGVAINKIVDLSKDVEDQELKFDICLAACEACLIVPNCNDHSRHSVLVTSHAAMSTDIAKKIRAYRIIARSLKSEYNYEASFDYFLKAKELIAQLDDDAKDIHTFELNGDLFDFYNRLNYLAEAAEYKRAQILFIQESTPIDSNILMWLKFDMADLAVKNQMEGPVTEYLDELLNYSRSVHDIKLLNYTQSAYRKLLLEKQDINLLSEIYATRYPELLEEYKAEDTSLYYNLLAYIQENKRNVDSSNFFFLLAENEYLKSDNIYLKSTFYKRYGQFLLRQNDLPGAIEKYTTCYNLAVDVNERSYMLPAASMLEDLHKNIGDYEGAYNYAKVHSGLKNIENKQLHEGDILKKELMSQERLRKYEVEKAEELKKKKNNLQYFIILIAIVVAIVLLVIVSSLTVPFWLIEMLGFFSILSLFEFLILLLDTEIHHFTHGAPLQMFIIKMVLLSVLFPLHHLIEKRVTGYMKKHRLIGKPSWHNVRKALTNLWPWLSKERTTTDLNK